MIWPISARGKCLLGMRSVKATLHPINSIVNAHCGEFYCWTPSRGRGPYHNLQCIYAGSFTVNSGPVARGTRVVVHGYGLRVSITMRTL